MADHHPFFIFPPISAPPSPYLFWKGVPSDSFCLWAFVLRWKSTLT